mgnify:CR=1 FL=1
MLTCTLCPQCGIGVPIDEDGCCTTCGCTATGPGVDAALSRIDGLEYDCSVWVDVYDRGGDPPPQLHKRSTEIAKRRVPHE